MTDTSPAPAAAHSGWRRAATVVFSLGILALALHGLANEFDEHGYRAIREAFRALGSGQIALTVLLGLASYACLIGFDAIGLRRSGKRLHPARIGITAFLAHTLGQTLGFAALTGGAVRLRGYGRAGLSLGEIGQVVLMSTLGFLFGAWVLLGLAFVLEPGAAALALPVPKPVVRVLGVLALLAYVATALLVGREGRTFRIRGHALWLPDRRTMLGVTALSVVELVLAAAAFYVLLPMDTPTGLPGFVGLYLVAVLAGLISSVPAGLGVFEWSLLKLLPQVPPAAVLAAALIYRVTYYVLPLLLATVLAVAPALRRPLRAGAGATRAGWTALRPWLPQIIALAVFSVGAA
ncbi:lysylphosphatidylglycerol synthase domain-containing protein, partial [Stenotrophomonas sp. PS02289]|uniref:lysylphosphatidylglycerol synthase domain-containing protein n=1 Tax=Stenotrophomonas sp. PS02289 TaxID=2991422 RepID=UPI00249B2E03